MKKISHMPGEASTHSTEITLTERGNINMQTSTSQASDHDVVTVVDLELGDKDSLNFKK